jgi:hypothetical protein
MKSFKDTQQDKHVLMQKNKQRFSSKIVKKRKEKKSRRLFCCCWFFFPISSETFSRVNTTSTVIFLFSSRISSGGVGVGGGEDETLFIDCAFVVLTFSCCIADGS